RLPLRVADSGELARAVDAELSRDVQRLACQGDLRVVRDRRVDTRRVLPLRGHRAGAVTRCQRDMSRSRVPALSARYSARVCASVKTAFSSTPVIRPSSSTTRPPTI